MVLPWSSPLLWLLENVSLACGSPGSFPCPPPARGLGLLFVVWWGWTPRLPIGLCCWGGDGVKYFCCCCTSGNYLKSFLLGSPLDGGRRLFLGPFWGEEVSSHWLTGFSSFQSEIHEAKNRHIGHSLPCSSLSLELPTWTTFSSSLSVLHLCYMQCPCFVVGIGKSLLHLPGSRSPSIQFNLSSLTF